MATDDALCSVSPASAAPRAFSFRALGDDAVRIDVRAIRGDPARPRSVSDANYRCLQPAPSPSSRSITFKLNGSSEREPGSPAPQLRHTFALGQVPSFVRELSSLIRTTSIDTFRCHICFDDVATIHAFQLAACGHRFCSSCFKAYLQARINDGCVYPVCFHPVEVDSTRDSLAGAHAKACGAAIETTEVERLVDPESWTKFNRFRLNRENEHARDCPYCSHSQVYAGPHNPVCTCGSCSKVFCFFHGNAHPDTTCADYELLHAESEALNRAKIKEIAKPCPGCQRNVEKAGGCNHMKCVACQTSFCWLCSEVIDDTLTPAHYDASNGGGCSGKQFDGMQTQAEQWWLRIYVTLATVLCGPPALIVGFLVTPVIWCLKPQQSLQDAFDGSVRNVTMILQAPLALVFFAIVIILQGLARAFMYLFRAVRRAACRSTSE